MTSAGGWIGRGLLGLGTAGMSEAVGAAAGVNIGDEFDSLGQSIGGVGDDFMNAGKNRFTAKPFEGNPAASQWGGNPDMANEFAADGKNIMYHNNGMADWAGGEAINGTGAQSGVSKAYANKGLSNQEAGARGFQNDAMGLAGDAARGNAPSQAQYLMQSGLDQSMASQQAMAGGARGAAGLALAGGNMAANNANLQNQTYNQMGALRANEMAQARGMYGDLSGQMRTSDQSRIGQDNQMKQFNAGQTQQNNQFNANSTNSYKLGMGNLANGYSNTAIGGLNAGAGVYNAAGTLGMQGYSTDAQSHDNAQMTNAGIMQANADSRKGQGDRLLSTGLSVFQTAGNAGKK